MSSGLSAADAVAAVVVVVVAADVADVADDGAAGFAAVAPLMMSLSTSKTEMPGQLQKAAFLSFALMCALLGVPGVLRYRSIQIQVAHSADRWAGHHT